MNGRGIVVACAIAALAIAAAVLLDRGSAPAETTDATPRATATAAAPPDPIDVAAQMPVRAEIAPATTMLTVLDAKTREPVAGAQVWVLSSIPADPGKVGWDIFEPEQETVVQRNGTHYVAASDGRVELPERAASWVLAVDADRVGCEHFAAAPAIELLIESNSVLRIRVTDEAGQPQGGIPVALLVGAKSETRGRVWSGETATPDGIATLWHPDSVSHREDIHIHAGLFISGIDAPEVEVSLVTPPREPIELVLPPTGTIQVELVRDGAPLQSPARVTLLAAPEPVRPWIRAADRSRTSIGGTVLFEHVALNVRYRVSAEAGGQTFGAGTEFDGPSSDGQLVVRTVECGSPACFVGRLLGADGSPLRNRDAVAALNAVSLGIAMETEEAIRTDEAGDFRFEWSEASNPNLHCEIEFAHVDDAGHESRAFVSLAKREIRDGVNDLGDVALVPQLTVIAGTLVDARGEGAEGNVYCETRGADGKWRPFASEHVEAHSSFAFDVKKPSLPATLRVNAKGPKGAQSAWLEVAPGTTGLRLVLSRTGSVEGSVRLLPGMDRWGVDLVLSRTNGVGDSRPDRARPDARGAFVFPEVLPGLVKLEVVAAAEVVASIDAIRVVEDEVARDPRIQDIVLESATRALTFDVVDSTGRAVERAAVQIRGADGQATQTATSIGGRVRLVVPRRGIDCDVFAPGYRNRRLTAVTSDKRVVLECGIAVVVRVVGRTAVTDGRRSLEIRLIAADPLRRARSGFEDAGALGADGTATISCRDPGAYDVVPVIVEHHDVGQSRRELAPVTTVNVADVAGPQSFEIALPADLWQDGK